MIPITRWIWSAQLSTQCLRISHFHEPRHQYRIRNSCEIEWTREKWKKKNSHMVGNIGLASFEWALARIVIRERIMHNFLKITSWWFRKLTRLKLELWMCKRGCASKSICIEQWEWKFDLSFEIIATFSIRLFVVAGNSVSTANRRQNRTRMCLSV